MGGAGGRHHGIGGIMFNIYFFIDVIGVLLEVMHYFLTQINVVVEPDLNEQFRGTSLFV